MSKTRGGPAAGQSGGRVRIVDVAASSYQVRFGFSCLEDAVLFQITDSLGGGYYVGRGLEEESGDTSYRVEKLEFVRDLEDRPSRRMSGDYSRDNGREQGTFTRG